MFSFGKCRVGGTFLEGEIAHRAERTVFCLCVCTYDHLGHRVIPCARRGGGIRPFLRSPVGSNHSNRQIRAAVCFRVDSPPQTFYSPSLPPTPRNTFLTPQSAPDSIGPNSHFFLDWSGTDSPVTLTSNVPLTYSLERRLHDFQSLHHVSTPVDFSDRPVSPDAPFFAIAASARAPAQHRAAPTRAQSPIRRRRGRGRC